MNLPNSSSRFRAAFKNTRVVLPVIHVETLEQALRNADIAHSAGADGVFLINHSSGYKSLLEIHAAVDREFPNWWIGVNCLDLRPQSIFSHINNRVAGVWTDNALIDEHQVAQPLAEKVLEAQQRANWNGLYFGGVAFKYQRRVDDVGAAAKCAAQYMEVVTTSGSGTGHAAHVEKIHAMKQALGTHPLAIASGITPENVDRYLPYADCFLVATGISHDFTNLDPVRVCELVDKVRQYHGK